MRLIFILLLCLSAITASAKPAPRTVAQTPEPTSGEEWLTLFIFAPTEKPITAKEFIQTTNAQFFLNLWPDTSGVQTVKCTKDGVEALPFRIEDGKKVQIARLTPASANQYLVEDFMADKTVYADFKEAKRLARLPESSEGNNAPISAENICSGRSHLKAEFEKYCDQTWTLYFEKHPPAMDTRLANFRAGKGCTNRGMDKEACQNYWAKHRVLSFLVPPPTDTSMIHFCSTPGCEEKISASEPAARTVGSAIIAAQVLGSCCKQKGCIRAARKIINVSLRK